MSSESQDKDRSLIIRSEQTSLDHLTTSNYLRQAGFSPQFPQILMRLNDVLPHRSLTRLSLELHPGNIPLIDAHAEHGAGYRFFVDSRPQSNLVELSLIGSGRHFHIDDIKNFTNTVLPDQSAILHAKASRHLIEPIDDFNEDLQKVTEEVLRTWFDELPANESSGKKTGEIFEDYPYGAPRAEVRVENQQHPLFLLIFWMMHYDENTVGCELSCSPNDMSSAFYFSGKPERAEKAMEELTSLFDKPFIYPYKRR